MQLKQPPFVPDTFNSPFNSPNGESIMPFIAAIIQSVTIYRHKQRHVRGKLGGKLGTVTILFGTRIAV